MSKETWFCRKCGGTDIRHDAIVEYNPVKGDYEVVSVLDDTWCEDCMSEDWNDNGDPAFGIPSEDEETELAAKRKERFMHDLGHWSNEA